MRFDLSLDAAAAAAAAELPAVAMADVDEMDPAMRSLLKKRPTMQKMPSSGSGLLGAGGGSRSVQVTGTGASLRELVAPSTLRAAGSMSTMSSLLQQRTMSRRASDGRAKASVPVKLHH